MRGGSVLTCISTVFLSTRARKCIQYEVRRYPNVETGGILMGVQLSNDNFLVTHATSAGPNAIRKHNKFGKDWCYTLNVLNYLEKRCFVTYLGEWHSHTLASKPSFKDIIAMKRATRKNKVPLLLLIVSGDGEKVFYLISPSIVKIKIKELSWKEVDNPEEIYSKYLVVVT
jgi:integrative and conjugative element protein (TIGR02256 family)